MEAVKVCLIVCCLLGVCLADTPGNCTYEEVKGVWKFQVGQRNQDRTVDCSSLGPVSSVSTLELTYPDEAVDEYGNRGFWTMVYNQGFEVVIHGRKYFAFSKYEGEGENATSYCDQTMVGWSHNTLGHDWACYQGQKVKPSVAAKKTVHVPKDHGKLLYKHNPDYISAINAAQSSWKAGHYAEYETMTIEGMIRRAGGRKSILHPNPTPAAVSAETQGKAEALPEKFDWRDVNGVNFVSPVRNQGQCGSCFAFASMAMNECRLRILTNNTVQVTLSPQDIVDCSQYSQGCDGGFPYLIAGKYAEDYGLVEESCNPYRGSDTGSCGSKATCPRHYSSHYRYIGGYYGASNEEEMKLSLVNHGPLVIGFEVYPDLQAYQGGVYVHTGLVDRFNPFELTNHAVLLVGYGVDSATGMKYWSIKNSWGETWGEQGFFRILRGVDECAVESCTVEAFPVF